MRDCMISVAMATYNGEKHIKEQISSILTNLEPQDELVISDDGSTDRTLEIIESFHDSRIIVVEGPMLGIKKNFENAIMNTGGRYIFLSDQDDIWEPDKVQKVVETFEKTKAPVVVHDCQIVSEDGNILEESFYDFRKSGPGAVKNFVKNTYIGCCMAFDAALKDAIVPIPLDIEMHDQWIGIIGDLLGKNVFISDKLIKYVRHENTASDIFNHHSIGLMLVNRINLFKRLTRREK